MEGLLAVCPVHGAFRASLPFGLSAQFISIDTVETNCFVAGCKCPARIVNGTYEFVGNVVHRLFLPGISLDQIEAFEAIVKDVKDGKVPVDQADELATVVNSRFSGILQLATTPDFIIILLTMLGIIVGIYAARSADNSADQAHKDFQDLNSIQQKIYEELQRQPDNATPMAAPSSPKARSMQLRQPQTTGSVTAPNRHARRRAAKLDRRKSRSPPP